MTLDRRTLLVTGAAALATPAIALAATGPRMFELYRGKSRIGRQTLDVSTSGASVQVAIDISIVVRILGLPAYSYSLSSRETWEGGTLQRLDSSSNDNGTPHRVSALRQGGALTVQGTGFSGKISGNPATTTYWSQAFLNRGTWISTQDGRPMAVSASRGGEVAVPVPGGQTQATRWKVRGDIGRLDLFFDANAEWIGNEFDARGETARFVLSDRGKSLAGLLL